MAGGEHTYGLKRLVNRGPAETGTGLSGCGSEVVSDGMPGQLRAELLEISRVLASACNAGRNG